MVNIDNLFKLIALKGINQSKLAEDTSISTGNISDWKKGKSMPSAVKLDELASYFGCSVDYLLGRTETPELNNGNGINIGDNSVNNNTNVNISTASVSEIEEFAEMMKGLSLVQRSKVVVMIDEMKKEN